MSKNWRTWLDEDDKRSDKGPRIKKIRKEKRSIRGRTTDDWLIDVPSKEERKTFNLKKKLETLAQKGYKQGRVIEVHKRGCFVAEETELGKPDTGALWFCSVAKRHFQRAHKERNFVVVGDRVLIIADKHQEFDKNGEPVGDLPRGVVQHAFSRKTKVSRKDPLHREWEHVMLANVDRVIVTASVLNPPVRWGLIDRFLVQAEMCDLPAIIVLNKVDLLQDDTLVSEEFRKTYRKRVAIFRKIGYEVLEICALNPEKTPDDIERLKELTKGNIVGFSGHSGVGKSSLINLMEPEYVQEVDADPEIFYKGRHTTTYNTLLRLGIGAYAIDTPGVRSFAIESPDPILLTRCFREFPYLKCQYRECQHVDEPNCEVKEALESGEVSQERYRSYLGLLRGVSFREGRDGKIDYVEAEMVADLKARELERDRVMALMKQEEEKDQETKKPDEV